MKLDAEIEHLAIELGRALGQRGWLAATAESCTGGGVASAITDIAGSSGWFDRGFVTYTNEAKQQMLGVSDESLELHGAVSEAVVLEMARGALAHSSAAISVAISGIAGPGGATGTSRSAPSGSPGPTATVVTTPCWPASTGIADRYASRR